MTPEGRVKKDMTTGLKRIQALYPGRLVYWMPVVRGMGKTMLDYLVCADGRFVMIETKRDDKHDLTALQKQTRREVEAAGGTVLLVYDVTTAVAAAKKIEAMLHAPCDRIAA